MKISMSSSMSISSLIYTSSLLSLGILLGILFIGSEYVLSLPINMVLNSTYQDNAPPGSMEGARGVQVDPIRKLAFISSNTDDSLTAINYSNPSALTFFGEYLKSAPQESIDGIVFGTLDYIGRVFYAPSSTDDQTTFLNVSATGTFVAMNSTAVDTAGAGSQEEIYDVIYVDIAGTRWLITGGRTDDYVSSFNVTDPLLRPANVNSFTDSAGACSVDGMFNMHNIPGTSLIIVAATVDNYITVLNVSEAGAFTCLGTGYTDTAGAGSIEGVQQFFYETDTGYLYVTSPTDGWLTILTNVASGTPTLVGSVGGLTSAVSVHVLNYTIGGTKYAFVGSSASGQGVRIINVSNAASPTIIGQYNETSGTCIYNGTHSMFSDGEYLFASSGADACFYSIKLSANSLMNISLSYPDDEYYNIVDQSVNLTFNATVTDDDGILNCSLWTNYSGTWALNQTQTIGGTSNITSFILTGLSNSTFMWNIQCYDIFGDGRWGVANRTVTLNYAPPIDSNFSIQKYYVTLGDGVTSAFIPFTGGQTGINTVPFVTMRVSFTATNDFWNLFLPDVYFNSTGIIVNRFAGGSSVMNLLITVVEFDSDSVRVQSGTFSLTSGSTSPSIGYNVNLSNSALIFYYNSTDATDDYMDNSIRGNITGVNQLNFITSAATGVKAGHWYVFESLDGGFTVQRTMLNFAAADTSASGTLSAVDTEKTFLIASYITGENDDDPRDGSLYVNLSSSTTVTGIRLGTPAATLNANVFAITFSGNEVVRRGYFNYAAATASDSESLSAVNTNFSVAWNPVLTGRMASTGTAAAIESSFQLLNLTSYTSITGLRSETVGNTQGVWEVIDWMPLSAPVVESVTVDDDIPPVGEIVLSAGHIRMINCTILSSDSWGASNIENASATFYYYLNNSFDQDHNATHYTNNSCDYVSNTSMTKTFMCGFNTYYYANNGTWHCNATVYSGVSLSSSAYNSTTILPLYALNLTDGISFGVVPAGEESLEISSNITNIGNMPINITLQGYAQTIGDNVGMNCSDNTNITVTNIRFIPYPDVSYIQKRQLNGSIQHLNITLPKQVSSSEIFNNTFWQVAPDPGSVNRYCEGRILFSAEAP